MAVAERTRTPDPDRVERAGLILQSQRQALIDNLQLEITERARKLRAQYAFQAQSMRTRLEMRVNRIPTSLRKRNIQEFLDEHSRKSKPAPAPPLPVLTGQRPTLKPPPARQPSAKRKSEQAGEDKENADTSTEPPNLDPPRKRAKTQADSKAVRSNATNSNGVLSPKSHNSRLAPQSPMKTGTTLEKLGLSRPASPLKALKKVISKPKLQASARQQTKQTAKDERRSSEGSDTSNATTIVKRTNSRKVTTTRKPPVPKAATVSRKPVAAKKETAVPTTATTTTASGRTLRKRG